MNTTLRFSTYEVSTPAQCPAVGDEVWRKSRRFTVCAAQEMAPGTTLLQCLAHDSGNEALLVWPREIDVHIART